MQFHTTIRLGAFIAAGLSLTACDKKDEAPPPETKAAAVVAEPPAEAAEPVDPMFYRVEVMVHPTLASTCQIPAPKAFFPYDSEKLSWGDRQVIETVAKCLESDALKDAGLRLVGRADPRGPSDYNKKLGKSRAQAVAEALEKEGIAKDRIRVVSRGERGTDQPDSKFGYALDRRVDIQVVGAKPAAIELTYWDVDGDGKVGRAEFYTYVAGIIGYDGWDADQSGGLDAKETSDAVLGTWDEDGDGAISKDEWGFGAKGMFPDDDRFGTFETWDVDSDGRIEGKEWGLAFTDKQIAATWDTDKDAVIYDYELVEPMWQRLDADGDGVVSFDELGEMERWAVEARRAGR